jgi:hypothetical protein
VAYFNDDRKQVQREAINTFEVNTSWLLRLYGIASVLRCFESFRNVRMLYVKSPPYSLLWPLTLSRVAEAKVSVAKGDAGDVEVVFVGC